VQHEQGQQPCAAEVSDQRVARDRRVARGHGLTL
jgi:hypothetical protein